MIFNKFKDTAKKYPKRLAVNSYTYDNILDMVHDGQYQEISQSPQELILVDILRASYLNKPLVILPKVDADSVTLPKMGSECCLYLYSSGSTGERKPIKLSQSMLLANADMATNVQKITSNDKILTVCSMNHTGGINAQSLPGLLNGSHILVQSFNPYTFCSLVQEYKITLTHLVPVMIDALYQVKKFYINNNVRLVVAGSDCLYKKHVELFTNQQIPFMINYGLTEAGPMIINHIFHPNDDLDIFNYGIPLGTKECCETMMLDGELFLRGNNVWTDDWLPTGDCVYRKDLWFMYLGRKSAGCKVVPKNY